MNRYFELIFIQLAELGVQYVTIKECMHLVQASRNDDLGFMIALIASLDPTPHKHSLTIGHH